MPVATAASFALPAIDIGARILGTRGSGKRTRQNWAREDTAIQRRVMDARIAGVHPLFALGGAIGSGGAQVQQSQTGSEVGKALRYLQKRSDTQGRATQSSLVDKSLIEQAAANSRLANARADSVEWQLNNSIVKRAESASNSEQDPLVDMENVRRFHPVKGKKHQLPGEQPVWNRMRVYPDLTLNIPFEEMSDLFDNMNAWPMVYDMNHKAINAWLQRASDRNRAAFKKSHPAFKMFRWFAKKANKKRGVVTYPYPQEVSP